MLKFFESFVFLSLVGIMAFIGFVGVVFLLSVLPLAWGLFVWFLFWLAPVSMNAFKNYLHLSDVHPFSIGFCLGVFIMAVKAMFGRFSIRIAKADGSDRSGI